MRSVLKRITFLFVLLALSASFLYASQKGYTLANKINKKFLGSNTQIVDTLDRLIFEVDIRRLMRKYFIDDDQFIDLKLSRSDLSYLQNVKEKFINQGFIRDSDNPWKNGEILIGDSLVKIGFKLHGTSVTPLKKGGLSMRLRHKQEGPYYDYVRDFKLITAYDEADITTIVINHLASIVNLIAPSRKFVTLRINGNDMGLYQFEEHHSKEWFERRIKLTNYTIIKSHDDWDRKESAAHISNTDLWIQNKEYKTSSEYPSVALGALDVLLIAIRQENVYQIKEALDLHYFARFVAFNSIINNNHPITGDNFKYIYENWN